MSQRKVPIPQLPLPPREYSQTYMSDLIRAYEQAVRLLETPGEGRQSTLVLTNLPNDDVALEAGSLYRDGNVVKISVLHIAAVRSASATGSVGTVTVVT